MASSRNVSPWTTVSISPLIGVLDVRSRPADVPRGGVRWRLNCAASDEGKMCLRDGFSRAFSSSTPYTNFDHHHQGTIPREPITLIYESTDSSGVRRLFDATQSRVSKQDANTGLWTDIVSGKGAAGTRFKCDQLQDQILFTNNYDNPFLYDVTNNTLTNPVVQLGTGDSTLPLGGLLPNTNISKARIAIQYQGVMFLMNIEQDGQRKSSRIHWSDLNDPTAWIVSPPDNICGFQDLTYGDDILAAATMNGILYVYTARGIWRIGVNNLSPSGSSAFYFQQVYAEPKNQAGCLAFPNTLVSTGSDHYYMGRDGIYHYNQYLTEPERVDWIHRADGVIYKKSDTAINAIYCGSPVSEYSATAKELWFSWPSAGSFDNNNWTLVLNIGQNSADIIDAGFTAFCNFRPGSSSGETCREIQDFIGASGKDWCLKELSNGVFSREFAVLNDVGDPPLGSLVPVGLTNDIPPSATYQTTGYDRIIRGIVPTGLTDREKFVRMVLIDSDDTPQSNPCVINVRIGNSRNLVDVNDMESFCAPQWFSLPPVFLQCIEGKTIPQLTAMNQRPSKEKIFPCYVQGTWIYFEIVVRNLDGTPAIGADSCFLRIDFDVSVLPKP
jgi:hypothetical protein